MSRSSADATRFTATSPHAYSKPTPTHSSPQTPSQPQQPRRPPPNTPPRIYPETAQERVARLRALRVAARDAQLSTWERIVVRGRVWADRAHKTFAITLIGFTFLAGGIAAFALTDMILHNRRKRAAFYAEQHALYASRLIAAVETERAGLPLTDDQTLVLNRERAKIAAEEERKRASWWGGVKGVFVGGLKSELDGAEEKGGGVLLSEAEVLERVGVAPMEVLGAADGKRSLDAEMGRGDRRVDWQSEGEKKRGGVLEAVAGSKSMEGGGGDGEKRVDWQGVEGEGTRGRVLGAVEEKRREGTSRRGGPLDQMADTAVENVKGSWLGWGRGR